jgi:hypothetical protein
MNADANLVDLSMMIIAVVVVVVVVDPAAVVQVCMREPSS